MLLDLHSSRPYTPRRKASNTLEACLNPNYLNNDNTMNFSKLYGQAIGNNFCEQYWLPSNYTHSQAPTLMRAKMSYLTKMWRLPDDLLTGTLFVLPPEIHKHIVAKLRVKDVATFMQVNSYWYDLIKKSDYIWRQVFQSEMPDTLAYLSRASALSAYEGVKKQAGLWPSLFRKKHTEQNYFQTYECTKILQVEAQDRSLYICTDDIIIKKTDNVFETLFLDNIKDRDETPSIVDKPLLFHFQNNTLYIAYAQSISEVKDSPANETQMTENHLLKQALVINNLAVSKNLLFLAGWEWSESTIPLFISNIASKMWFNDRTTWTYPTELPLEIHIWHLQQLDAPKQIVKFDNPLLDNLFAFDDNLIANFLEPGENSPFESRLWCWQSPSFSSKTQFGTMREIKLEIQANCFTFYNQEVFIGTLDKGICRFDFESLTIARMDLGSAWPTLGPKQILCYDGKILTQLHSGKIVCTDISTGKLKGFLPSKWQGMTMFKGHPVCFTEDSVVLLEGK